jgi:hypothetical protein
VTDRELLELAAKAAGIGPISWIETDGTKIVTNLRWNPLTDDGDALRLAVKLGLYDLRDLPFQEGNDPVWQAVPDPYAAVRRAIVRAAVEIEQGLRPFPTAEEIRDDWT